MDAEIEDNIAYAEAVAAASSDPPQDFEHYSWHHDIDVHGFRHLGTEEHGTSDDMEQHYDIDSHRQGYRHFVESGPGPSSSARVHRKQYLAGGAHPASSSPSPSSANGPWSQHTKPSELSSTASSRYSLPPAKTQLTGRRAQPSSSFIPVRPASIASKSDNASEGFNSTLCDTHQSFQSQAPSRIDSASAHFRSQVKEHHASGLAARAPDRPKTLSRLPQNTVKPRDYDEQFFGDQEDAFFEAALQESMDAQEDFRRLPRAPQPTRSRMSRPAGSASARTAAPVLANGIRLRPVSEIPDAYRSLWPFGVFNAVQSSCFDIVYQSDKNLVVSAPTGAGKTVLFELATLRMLTTSSSSNAKVVYLAPTKSLCTERAQDWRIKFERLGYGWTVIELTGDSQPGAGLWASVKKARIIVTTPEKWDSITRSWNDHEVTLGLVRLFCVDECHSVGTDVRGATLEVVVSRVKHFGGQRTRFIAVSATVPNIHDIAEWFGSGINGEPAVVKEFGDSFRPCPLQKIVIGYPSNGNDFQFASNLNNKVYGLIKQYCSSKAVLIFCDTRKACSQVADVVAKEYKKSIESQQRDVPWKRPGRVDCILVDKKLEPLIELGIAYHHAGLDSQDRRAVEQLFLDGKITVLCATSTLAVGVNLPARTVIIKGTSAWRNGRTEALSDTEILQMIGRAGRPQFDTSGVAIILTENANRNRYENLINAQATLESCLHQNLAEHVNSEITLGTVSDVETALHWLRSTFLYIRIQKNPAYYALGSAKTLEEICVRAVDDLVANGIVEVDNNIYKSTAYGEMMSKFYLAQPTLVSIMTLPSKASMRDLLEVVASAAEFNGVRFRQGEKSVFANIAKDLRYPIKKPSTSQDKVMIWLQIILEGHSTADLKTDSSNPNSEVAQIWPHVIKIVKCIVDVLLERCDGAIKSAVELLRSVHSKAWDSSPCILRAFEGIGEKSVKVLADKGIIAFQHVRDADPERLQLILSRNAPFGRKLVLAAKSMPQFSISLTSKQEESVRTGVQVDLLVEIGVLNTKPACLVKKGSAALIVLTTSDGEYIEFRRIRLDHLVAQSPKSFSISVVVVKPSQRIVGAVSCDLIAGTEVKTFFKPSTPAHLFPLPGGSEPEAIEVDQLDELDVDDNVSDEGNLELGGDDPHAEAASVHVSSTARKRKAIDADFDDELATQPPSRRKDGKYDCNHTCKDKGRCRHLCCRDGCDKPPRRSKSKTQTAVPSTSASTQDRSALGKTKAKILAPLEQLSSTQKQKAPRISSRPPPANVSNARLKSWGNMSLKELFPMSDDEQQDGPSSHGTAEEDLLTLDDALSMKRAQPSRSVGMTQGRIKSKNPGQAQDEKRDQSDNNAATGSLLNDDVFHVPEDACTDALLDDEVDQLEDDSDVEPLETLKIRPDEHLKERHTRPSMIFSATAQSSSPDADSGPLDELCSSSQASMLRSHSPTSPNVVQVQASKPGHNAQEHGGSLLATESSDPKPASNEELMVEEDEFEQWLRDSVIVV